MSLSISGVTNLCLHCSLLFGMSIINLEFLVLGLPGLLCFGIALQEKQIVAGSGWTTLGQYFIRESPHKLLTSSKFLNGVVKLSFSSWIADLI